MGESVTHDGVEVKSKFSLKAPVEETKTLLAIHNKEVASILSVLAANAKADKRLAGQARRWYNGRNKKFFEGGPGKWPSKERNPRRF